MGIRFVSLMTECVQKVRSLSQTSPWHLVMITIWNKCDYYWWLTYYSTMFVLKFVQRGN